MRIKVLASSLWGGTRLQELARSRVGGGENLYYENLRYPHRLTACRLPPHKEEARKS